MEQQKVSECKVEEFLQTGNVKCVITELGTSHIAFFISIYTFINRLLHSDLNLLFLLDLQMMEILSSSTLLSLTDFRYNRGTT
jgi:hypothetical protein